LLDAIRDFFALSTAEYKAGYLLSAPDGRPWLSRDGPESTFSPLFLVVVAAADLPVGSEAIPSPGRLGVVLLTVSFGGGWADTPATERTRNITVASERVIINVSP
jgi:hypothetical protein